MDLLTKPQQATTPERTLRQVERPHRSKLRYGWLVCNVYRLRKAKNGYGVGERLGEPPRRRRQAVQLSAAGGYLWFFGPDDSELVIKVVDGRVVNGHIWVFYASLTDVEFDLTVTDSHSATHASRTYHNSAGTLASAEDLSAF